MRSRRLVSCALLLAGLSLVAQIEANSNPFWWIFRRQRTLVDEYDLLNSHLVMRVKTDSPRENLDATAELLKEVEANRTTDHGVELPSKEALVLFIELNNLLDPVEPHCDMFARDILLRNERATASYVLRPLNDQRPLRRVGMVVHQAAYEHAEQCLFEYPKKFAEFKVERNKRPMREVREMMQAMIKTKELFIYGSQNMDKRHLEAMKARSVSLTGESEARALLGYLRRRAREQLAGRNLAEGQSQTVGRAQAAGRAKADLLRVRSDPQKRNHWMVDTDELRRFMSSLIYERCEYLFHRCEPIFEPAILEQKLYPERQRYKPYNDNIAIFMIWLEYYRLCKEMTSSKRQVENAVLKAIWDELEPVN